MGGMGVVGKSILNAVSGMVEIGFLDCKQEFGN
jgi:hypothetical protein